MKHDKHQGKHKKHKKKYTKKEITTEIKNIALIIVGSIILGIGTGIFLVPFNIVAGGVTGLGIVINEWLSPIIPEVAFEFISGIGLDIMDVYVTALTWLMFFMGLFILGKNFALKTLLSSIFYPIFFTLSNNLVTSGAFGGFLAFEFPIFALHLNYLGALTLVLLGRQALQL